VRSLLTIAFSATLLADSSAADWPQFLGTNRDSSSPEKVAAWKEKPKELWSKPVGEAHSSPVVAKGVVYAFYKVAKKDADALAAFDAKTGDLLWEQSYERAKFQPLFGEGPRGTPTVDGDRVYTLGNTGVLACWDASKKGEIVWKVDTLKEFKAKNLVFGASTSPTVVGKHVVIMVGGKGAGIVGFDKETGKVAWQATEDTPSYASPIPVGKDELVFLTNSHVRSVSAADGKEIWKFPFTDALLESSTTPVKVGDLFVVGSVKTGSVAIRIGEKGGKAEQVWKNDKLTCYFSTPVAVGDYLYMVNGKATLQNAAIILRCVEAKTGKIAWEKPNVGKYHAALVKTGDGKLLFLDDGGNLMLLEPNGEAYKELARAKVCGETWAHPALSDGRLYLRDDKKLICLQLGAE
jgi:outer membrane protein assembly factor BamB